MKTKFHRVSYFMIMMLVGLSLGLQACDRSGGFAEPQGTGDAGNDIGGDKRTSGGQDPFDEFADLLDGVNLIDNFDIIVPPTNDVVKFFTGDLFFIAASVGPIGGGRFKGNLFDIQVGHAGVLDVVESGAQ